MVRSVVQNLIDPGERFVSMTPMLHASGLLVVVGPAIFVGGECVILPGYDPGLILDAVEQRRCTCVVGLPALLRMVVNEQIRSPRDVSSVRKVLGGGDAVPVALQEDVKRLFGVSVCEAYAMTECCPITINHPATRTGSIGSAALGVTVRIGDADGNDAPHGAIGEILARGESCCSGYWDDPAETERLFRNGWMRTGDLGRQDSDGYFWFEGRLKQIIIRGGSNISPLEVEEALYRHPAVFEAGVVGSPDQICGEVPVAFIALRPGMLATERDVLDHTQVLLADYKVPERIFFRAELPKGITGKVDRRVLRESLLATAANA
jgi:long-chain acyl-CoA synthetase